MNFTMQHIFQGWGQADGQRKRWKIVSSQLRVSISPSPVRTAGSIPCVCAPTRESRWQRATCPAPSLTCLLSPRFAEPLCHRSSFCLSPAWSLFACVSRTCVLSCRRGKWLHALLQFIQFGMSLSQVHQPAVTAKMPAKRHVASCWLRSVKTGSFVTFLENLYKAASLLQPWVRGSSLCS